ncbi:hypothetical protein Pan44_50400 [Caulifigura coniformis]|uniref:Uncharacterized protein n=1 Tax=Caulifigura coniformis TaxID=2527983 RepID=A0A517SLI0_9PLAN|nr:hypothetical protein Pan44_50400 [Caulifigura coniformis]
MFRQLNRGNRRDLAVNGNRGPRSTTSSAIGGPAATRDLKFRERRVAERIQRDRQRSSLFQDGPIRRWVAPLPQNDLRRREATDCEKVTRPAPIPTRQRTSDFRALPRNRPRHHGGPMNTTTINLSSHTRAWPTPCLHHARSPDPSAELPQEKRARSTVPPTQRALLAPSASNTSAFSQSLPVSESSEQGWSLLQDGPIHRWVAPLSTNDLR